MATEAVSEWQQFKAAGNAEYTAGRTQEAVDNYTKALKALDVPSNERATILCNRAQCYLKLGEHGSAAEDCTACLTISPENVKALFRRAAALEALGQKADALRDYKDALRLNATVQEAIAGVKRLEAALGLPSSLRNMSSSRGSGSGNGTSMSPSGVLQLSEEDHRIFQEVRQRVKEVARQKAKAQAQHTAAAREKRQAELTLAQVNALNDGTATYRAVGRMFLATPQADLKTQLADKLARAEQKLKVCSTTLEHLQKQEAEADNNFVETMTALQKKGARERSSE